MTACIPAAPRHGLEDPILDSRFDYDAISGAVRIDGSSTVFPVTEAAAEEFSIVANDVRVMLGFSGTGGGFEKLCRGELDLANASRPIREAELAACEENGISGVLETNIGIDALTVVVSPENDWATCMTVDELRHVFREGGARLWSDIRPEWPQAEVRVFHPGPDSGTFDYFNETIIEAIDDGSTHTNGGTSSEDDNVLAIGVESERHAIGYYGFAYFTATAGRVRAVAIDNGEGCVEPTAEAAIAGDYTPLSRPLYVYSRIDAVKEKPQVAAFMKFYLDNLDFLVQDAGYIPLPQDTKEAQLSELSLFLQRR